MIGVFHAASCMFALFWMFRSHPNYRVSSLLASTNNHTTIMTDRIFEIAPSATALFEFVIKNKDGKVAEESFKNKRFQVHARRVIGTVDLAVDLLEKNDLETLVPALKALGVKHARYGVKDEHFPIVGEALLDTLGKALGEDGFSAEVKEAWVGVYGVIADNMSAGLHEND